MAFSASGAGGAVSSLFGAIGDFQEAGAYGKAAALEAKNVQLTKQATAIQETQAQRQIYQVIGAQKAAVGASGFAQSGSANDILASSAQQGALTKTMLATQGLITEQNFTAQEQAYKAMQSAAQVGGIGDAIGGAMQIGAMFAGG